VSHFEVPAAEDRADDLFLEISAARHPAMGCRKLCIGNRTGTSSAQSAADTVNNRAPQPLAAAGLLSMIGRPATATPQNISLGIRDNGFGMALSAVNP
jgi:hypothetical protein